jgi:hypothetical protein
VTAYHPFPGKIGYRWSSVAPLEEPVATVDVENLETALEAARQARRPIAKEIAEGSANESALDRLCRAQWAFEAILAAIEDESDQADAEDGTDED